MAALSCSLTCHTSLQTSKTSLSSRLSSRRPSRVCQAPRIQPTRALFGGKGEGGGNPFGNMGALMENVKKAQQLVQVEAAKLQEELAVAEFEGFSEDETVKVVMSGNQEPRSVDITQVAMDDGPEELSKRVTEAMKDAHAKSVEGMKLKMKGLASSLGINQDGGMPKFPGM
ncbi:hypothetical protein WJX72_003541 [[Myrmecia] bisecta]|uniref:Nucleoid-associated protein n=1 Tax=[Myrmecia] bisecta TaxID=41462 RepID=A0AAW1Q8K4_9CHLO